VTGHSTEPPQYRPRIAAAYWHAIGAFVTAAVTEAAPKTAYTERELYAAATPLCLWAWQTAGMNLDRDVVFSLGSIDRFVAIGMPNYRSSAGKNTIRSRLLRMGEALRTNPATATRALRPLGNSDPTAPYLASEVIELRSWAAAQSNPDRRRNANALLALGLGAGLSGREIITVHSDDVRVGRRETEVRIRGARARSVVVLASWEAHLAFAANATGATNLFRGGRSTDNPNLITDFISRSRGRVQLQARRMRTTWLVHHLNAGTPAVILVAAAGMKSLAALDRFMPYADTPSPESAARALRGDHGQTALQKHVSPDISADGVSPHLASYGQFS
jgi:hypothetical protein